MKELKYWNKKDSSQSIKIVLELLAIPGPSCEEQRVIGYLRKKLVSAGLSEDNLYIDRAHQKSPYGGECGNLIVNLPGSIRGSRRLLSAHIDTVSVCVGSKPVVKEDRIVSVSQAGVGADNRSGVAVVLYAALKILQEKLSHPPLTLLFTVQEERGSHGAHFAEISHFGEPQLCFTWDGFNPENCYIGGNGKTNMEITIKGKASHAIKFDKGISAPVIAALAINSLVNDGWHGVVIKDGKEGFSNIGVIQGGEGFQTNVVVDRVMIRAEARETAEFPGFRHNIVKAYKEAFDKAALEVKNKNGCTGEIDFKIVYDGDSSKIDISSPVVLEAKRALNYFGLEPNYLPGGWLDIGWLIKRGYPAVCLGTGDREPHASKEYLVIKEYLQACKIALWLATEGKAK